MKIREVLIGALVSCLVVALGSIGAELAIRAIDGYPLSTLRLPQPTAKLRSSDRNHANLIPLRQGVDSAWFDTDPSQDRTPDPQLLELHKQLQPSSTVFDVYKYWNRHFVEASACQTPIFTFFSKRIFTFDPSDSSAFPRYRFLYNSVTPLLLRTNQYGFRSEAIDLNKDGQVIRIGFLGASTSVNTHSYNFSYPELVGFWLNKWISRRNPNLRIEVLNTGREGIDSINIATIMRTELAAFEPDFVVYYEGSNQFTPADITTAKPSRRTGLELLERKQQNKWLSLAIDYSAIARRSSLLVNRVVFAAGAEPDKPPYEVVWPKDVDEQSPPLDHPNLPSALTHILRDLDSIRETIEKIDGRMVMTSFKWLIKDGMLLDPVKHKGIFDYINIGLHPFRYRELERMANFQNRTFKKWADTHGIDFIDVAGEYPSDPDLFNDPIHTTYPGVRLHAWLMVQKLIPLIERELENRSLPKPQKIRRDTHPAFPGNPQTVSFSCDPPTTMLPLAELKPNNPESQVNLKGESRIEVVTASKPHYYAAEMYLTEKLPAAGERQKLRIDARLISGAAEVGILSKGGKRFTAWQTLQKTDDYQTYTLDFLPGSDQERLVFYNGPAAEPARIEIRSIGFQTTKSEIHVIGPGVIIK